MSRHRPWFPPEVHISTGRLCSAGSGCKPFPDVSARTQPSDSRVPFGGHLRFPSPAAYLGADASSLPRWPAARASTNEPRVGACCPAPRCAGSCRGETWASQVPGSSSSCVPWSYTPPDAASPRLLPVAKTAVAFRKFRPLGSRNAHFSRPHSPRPTRSRAYASPAASPRPSQGSLPAGAAYPFAGRASHPLDDNPNFMSSSHHPFPSDQPVLVALNSLSPRSSAR